MRGRLERVFEAGECGLWERTELLRRNFRLLQLRGPFSSSEAWLAFTVLPPLHVYQVVKAFNQLTVRQTLIYTYNSQIL